MGHDPVTGERRRGTATFRTRKEAESREREWLSQIEKGVVVTATKTTLAAHLRAWLDVVATTVRPTTLAGYRATVEHHLIPRVGGIAVAKITAPQIQATYTAMRADGVGVRTIQLAHLRLRQALDVAVAWNLRVENPCLKVKPPRAPQREMRTWSKEETRRFLAAAQDDVYNPIWLIALTTGLRRGEVLGLRWTDVDLTRATVTVRQCVTLLNNMPHIAPPKTAAGRRTLRLPDAAVDALRVHRDRALLAVKQSGSAWRDDALVFASVAGTVIHPRNLVRNYALIVKATGVPRIRFHDLRHTYATLSLSGGADIKTISSRLGHSSIQVTGDVYAHVTPEMDERATAVIASALFG
jgi:integrase